MSQAEPTDEPTDETLRERVDRLEREVATLRAQIEEDADTASSTLPPGASDYRDARVLEALAPGDTVGPGTLQDLYRDRTDVRDRETLRERIKSLVERGPFEHASRRRWRYVPEGGDSAR